VASATAGTSAAKRNGLSDILAQVRESQAWVLVAVLVVATLFIQPSVVTGPNGQELLRQLALLGLLTVAQSIVLIGGGIDLSQAANVRIASVAGATYFSTPDASLILGLLITVGVAVAVGLLNGALIGILGFPSFITTFAMLLILDGITLTYTQSASGSTPPEIIALYTEGVWFIPLPAVVLIVVTALIAFCMRGTVWGKSVYAVGGQATLASHAGVRVTRTTVSLYVISGLISGITALVLLSRSGVGDPLALQGMELLAVTAAVIGGVSLAGGRGSAIGGLGGAVFLTLVVVLLSQAGVPNRFLVLAQGVLILLALASYRQSRRARARST
jgi:ribose/xylose/arabinose/galactoside ABC-type transport system permease subunit